METSRHQIVASVSAHFRGVAQIIELSRLTLEYVRSGRSEAPFADILHYYRKNYAQTASLDARQVSLEADDVLETLAQALLTNTVIEDRNKLFDALTADLQSEVMRSLARKGIAPSKALSEGSFVLAAPRSLLEHLVGAFPELLFDGNYWDTTFKTLDYGDLQLTDRAREQIVNRARSLVADAAWLADADPTILASLKKEELIRGLMSVSLLRPDREVL